jgi:hypothetical protein
VTTYRQLVGVVLVTLSLTPGLRRSALAQTPA